MATLVRHIWQQWDSQIVSPGKACGEIIRAFANFRQLRQKCTTTSAPLMSTDGTLLSNKAPVVLVVHARNEWMRHLQCALLRCCILEMHQ